MTGDGFGGIFLGIGANLTPDGYGSPMEGCIAAIESLKEDGIEVLGVSPWYKTAPVPVSDQPWYHNAVIEVSASFGPEVLMGILHDRESRFGRVRGKRNAARVLDIDIVDFRGMVADGDLVLPHPRMHLRAFVLRPLRDLMPDWTHPVSGMSIDDLLKGVDAEQDCIAL